MVFSLVVRIVDAEFETLAMEERGWPREPLPEVGLVGRSNVGKSSLINALCNRKGLARVSQTPGRTRGLIFFRLTLSTKQRVRLVDFPGFGYAKVSAAERKGWQTMVGRYLEARDLLRGVLLLVDSRREVGEEEQRLAEWLTGASRSLPLVAVATKIDTLGKSERGVAPSRVRQGLGLPQSNPAVGFTTEEPEASKRLLAELCKLWSMPPSSSFSRPDQGP